LAFIACRKLINLSLLEHYMSDPASWQCSHTCWSDRCA